MGNRSLAIQTRDKTIQDSIDFMSERLESLTQQELASRLTINCVSSYVDPNELRKIPITILDVSLLINQLSSNFLSIQITKLISFLLLIVFLPKVFDKCAISERVKQELYRMYPTAKRAHLKTGGNFPYLSRPDEVNMHIVIHLRQFEGTRFSAKLESTKSIDNLSPSHLLPENGSTSNELNSDNLDEDQENCKNEPNQENKINQEAQLKGKDDFQYEDDYNEEKGLLYDVS